MKTFYKKFFSIFFTLTILISSVSPLVAPQKAYAQFSGSAQGGFNMSGVAGVVASCADIAGLIQRGISSLFSKVKSKADTQKVPTKDETTQTNTEKTKTEIKTNNTKERCLDALARYAVLKIMDKITLMTVEWINSGFQGNPFYPENRPNFFEQIAKDEVTTFTSWFSANPVDYPFGQILSETLLLTVQNRLEDNFRFSLNQVLQHNNQFAGYDTFTANFSVGGWAGYTAFSQPNNNIFGNYLMANQHLARRVEGTNVTITKNFQAELNEAGGLMNQRECAKTAANDSYYTSGDDYIDPENPLHLGGRSLIPPNGTMTQSIYESLNADVQAILDDENGTDAQAVEYNALIQRSTCVEWKTVTPGTFLAEQTTQALGSPLRTLELGDEFNENIGLIFDALAVQLFKKIGGGVRSLYNSSNDYSSDPNASNYNPLWSQVNNPDHGGSSQQVSITTIMNGNGTDPGIITIQQNYILQAGQNLQLLDQLIRDIRTLDYCVPGPQPNWVIQAETNLQDLVSNIYPYEAPVGTFPPDALAQARQYYAAQIQYITGINFNSALLGQSSTFMSTYNDFVSYINYVFTNYRDGMLATYNLTNPPPTMRPLATSLFYQTLGYEDEFEYLQAQVSMLTSVLPQLIALQSQFTALGPNPDPNSPQMQVIASQFAQLNSQGIFVNQAQLGQITTNAALYTSQLQSTDTLIGQCVNEVVGLTASNERVVYPYPSISNNPYFNQIPPPTNLFLNAQSFNNDGNPLDVSEWNDFDLNIPTTSTQTFAENLQSIY